ARGEQRLADWWPDRYAEIERQGQEADRFATPLLRRDVARRGERCDEEEAFTCAQKAAGRGEHHEVRRQQVERQRRDGDQRSADQQRAPPEPVARPADDRAEQERGDAEGPDRDAETPGVGTQRELREPRRDRQ